MSLGQPTTDQVQEPRLKGDKFKVVIVGVRLPPLPNPSKGCSCIIPPAQAGLGGLATAMAMA